MRHRSSIDRGHRETIAWPALAVIAGGLTVAWALAMLPAGNLAAQDAGSASAGSDPPGAVAGPIAGGEAGFYLGVASCAGASCHGNVAPQSQYDVLQNEYQTWLHDDPHQGAYNLLFNEESALIATNMRLEAPWRQPLCLDCHSVNVAEEARSRGSLAIEDGVSCEGCHGPASGWRDGHVDSDGWSHADSVERGMRDLRSVEVRSRLCLTCHLGDATRTVDHELIAAGHPELIFELDNYSERMPPHWNPDATHGIAAWALGQAVSFQEGLHQLARRAASDEWPELAEMQCTSCHHDLATGEERQRRGYRGRPRPGLPPWSPARWGVLRHLVAEHAPAALPGLDDDVAAIARNVALMNRPRQVEQAATRAAGALSGVIDKIGQLQWSADRTAELLDRIAADQAFILNADAQSAEQVLFAVQSLNSHLAGMAPARVDRQLTATLKELAAELEERGDYDRQRFVAALGALRG